MYGHNHKKKRRVWYHPFARSCAVHKWAELVSTTASCIDLEGRYGYQRKWAFRSGKVLEAKYGDSLVSVP